MSETRIITEPKVRLVGRQTIDEAALDAFLLDEGVDSWKSDTDIAGQKLAEVASRLCYKSYAKPRPGGNKAHLAHILEVAHGSILEHTVFNFVVTGISRSLTHEWVRHRAGWAYSQRSQRFCDERDGAFVVPEALESEVAQARLFIVEATGRADARAVDVSGDMMNMRRPSEAVRAGLEWLQSIETSQHAYGQLAHYLMRRDDPDYRSGKPTRSTEVRKKARGAARSVLPNATETQIFVTANARALRHFIEARGDEHADAEIRSVAFMMLAILQSESPNLFGDYAVEARGGVECIATPWRKI